VSTEKGILRFDFKLKKFESIHAETDLHRLSSGRYGLWGIDAKQHIHRVQTKTAHHHRIVDDALSVAASGMASCLGTTDGLWRFWPGRKKASDRLEDPMDKYDDGVKITAVAGDGRGGCWFADEHGSVGLVNNRDEQLLWRLPPDSPPVKGLLPREDGRLWVLSDGGIYLLTTGLAF